MRSALITTCIVTAMVGATAAPAQQRLQAECRQEIRALCGGDRGNIRACLRENHSELSETCSSELRERMKQRRSDRSGQSTKLPPQKFDVITYGDHLRQAVDFHRAEGGAGSPPLILFVHGGGWAMGDRTRSTHAKAEYFTGQGYAFASAGYRVLPDAPVEDQARDVAAAIAKLRSEADELGFDRDRIVLMGHSAGAHLAALVATDPSYAGSDMDAISAVVLLDGAGYDVPARMSGKIHLVSKLYKDAFGTDPARQAALSPITHTGGDDAPNWIILHVANRADSAKQSNALGEKLREAGADVEVVAVSNTSHSKLNRNLGADGDIATGKVDSFLAGLFR
ncbi:alpha/beta hydrolase [Pontixanthobacter aquaemixtae]|uniref:Alpha/beta fold hydrolase n=1 Tax=Pontixanthobacter aquaemixtae TaxID=1958940 RepID=A0A844ZPB7_9SPHN|nr:alpha/beta hydrolase [Pontixanthobacter aquaemixtae]MXO89583.1 alpha/beta fold hydrolase [Pontixanthobacter aquaemixtae]